MGMNLTVLIPRTPEDDVVLNRLQDYLSAGVLQPFSVARLSGDTREVLLSHADGQEPYQSLSGALNATSGCELVRLIVISISCHSDDERFSDFVQACHDELEEVTRDTGVKYIQGSIFACMPDKVLPYTIMGDHNRYFNFNLVVVPEDHIGESDAALAMISKEEELHEVMASMVALIGGLWTWLDGGPLDEFESDHDEHHDRIRLARATTRMASTEDVSANRILDQLEGRTEDGVIKRVPPRDCRAHPDAPLAIMQLHQTLVPAFGDSPIGFSYRTHSGDRGYDARARQLDLVRAMRLFASELRGELAAMPREVLDRIKGMVRKAVRATEEKVMKLTWGVDSSIVLDMMESTDLQKVMHHRVRYRDLEAHFSTKRKSDSSSSVVYRTAWKQLVDTMIAAADGSSVDGTLLPDSFVSDTQGSRIVDVDDIGLLAPKMFGTVETMSDSEVEFDPDDLKAIGLRSDAEIRVSRLDLRMVQHILNSASKKSSSEPEPRHNT